MAKRMNDEIRLEIKEMLEKKGWKGYSSGEFKSKDGSIVIQLSSKVLYVFDYKRNVIGIKVASLPLKDIVVTEEALMTEFIDVKI